MEVYSKARIASRCFLSEALLWLLVGRAPAVASSENPEGWWQDDEHAGEGGYVSDLEWLTPAECKKIGVPVDPGLKYAVELTDAESLSFHTIEHLNEPGSVLGKIYREKFGEHEIIEMMEYYGKHLDWLSELSFRYELPKAELSSAVLKGEVRAFCRNQFYREPVNDDRDGEIDEGLLIDPDGAVFVDAPLSIFRATSIDWQRSSSQVDGDSFEDICLDTFALLNRFPDREEKEITVKSMGDVLVALDRANEQSVAPRGRRPFAWDEMHRELGRWVERDAIPEKKEALIAELMEWCRRTWSRDVSRSAIQAQLRNFGTARKP